MKLYYFPGACSLGIHALLAEIGAPFELEAVDLKSGAQKSPDYLAVNPKGKVPALVRDSGAVLTEWPAIAYYLANKFPAAGLLPDDLEAAADAVSTAEYIVSTMHMQAFTRIYRPERFSAIADEHAAIRATGLQMFGEGLELLSQRLGDGAFLVGERLSIADTALLFVVFWAKRGEFPIPANVAALFERLKQRPAIRAVFEKEGLPL